MGNNYVNLECRTMRRGNIRRVSKYPVIDKWLIECKIYRAELAELMGIDRGDFSKRMSRGTLKRSEIDRLSEIMNMEPYDIIQGDPETIRFRMPDILNARNLVRKITFKYSGKYAVSDHGWISRYCRDHKCSYISLFEYAELDKHMTYWEFYRAVIKSNRYTERFSIIETALKAVGITEED